MVRKENCDHCKGNRYLALRTSDGRDMWKKCPHCGGQGYKIRIVR